MDIVRPDQIITLLLFLGVLGALWVWVKANREGLGAKLRQGKRITVQEVTPLSPQDRAMILRVDDREIFVIKSKGLPAVITDLGKVEVAE